MEKERSKIAIYREWKSFNARHYANSVNTIGLVSAGITLASQYSLFGKAGAPYYKGVALISLSHLVAFLILLLSRKAKSSPFKRSIESICQILPVFMWAWTYVYFFSLPITQKSLEIVLGGNFLVIFLVSYAIHRFDKIQYGFNFSSILFLQACVSKNIVTQSIATQIANCHILCIILMYFMRREFVTMLFTQYSSLRIIVPDRLAKFMAIMNKGAIELEYFKPKERDTVVLVSDWRDFQARVETISEVQMSQSFENYYNNINRLLNIHVPSGNFYMDWTADELFVIFFVDETITTLQMQREAISFALALIKEGFSSSRELFGGSLYYDVGLAAGGSLLGLMGPSERKKVTIVGKNPGRAKRLEAEAKSFRIQARIPNAGPVLYCDEEIAKIAVETGKIRTAELKETEGTEKNIKGAKVFRYFSDERQTTDSSEIKAA